jgi:uncharacterized protein YigA (DUF484 family)
VTAASEPAVAGPAPLSKAEAAALKARILRDPALVLDDREVMQALIEADGAAPGRNVVDLRGALVKRLELRLDRLERQHRTVIAAAYETLAGASQVHRAALLMLDQRRFADFLRALLVEAPAILALDAARLVLETEDGGGAAIPGLDPDLAARIVAMPADGIAAYVALGDAPGRDGVWLRAAPPEAELIWGEEAALARSEALVALDLGPGPSRAMLAFGAEDRARFSPDHGADLVSFLGGVVARTLRGWLAAPGR